MSGHSDFQIDHFIVTKGNWTPYGQLKQCQREIRSRERTVAQLELDLSEKAIDLEEAKEEFQSLSRFDHLRKQIEIQRIELAMGSISESIVTAKRELIRFRKLAEELEPLIDGNPEDLDRETWMTKIRVMLAVDFLCNGRPSTNLITLILSTPADFRRNVITEVMHTVNAMNRGDIPTAIEQTCKLIEQQPASP